MFLFLICRQKRHLILNTFWKFLTKRLSWFRIGVVFKQKAQEVKNRHQYNPINSHHFKIFRAYNKNNIQYTIRLNDVITIIIFFIKSHAIIVFIKNFKVYKYLWCIVLLNQWNHTPHKFVKIIIIIGNK
jgi:hypothetical protein